MSLHARRTSEVCGNGSGYVVCNQSEEGVHEVGTKATAKVNIQKSNG